MAGLIGVDDAEEPPEEWDGDWRLLKRNPLTGIEEWWRKNADGTCTIRMTQDVEPIFDYNRAKANHNDGWSADKELRRFASVPMTVIQDFKNKGVDLMRPEADLRTFKRIMNDGDFSKFRTAYWRV